MRAWAVASDQRLERCERAAVDPADDEVAVAVEGVNLTGRDRLLASDGRIPGGAAVGVVRRAGSAASELIGSRVLIAPASPCGECDLCRRGGAPVCAHGSRLGGSRDGALADEVIARGRWVCPLTDELAIDGAIAAAVAGDLALAYSLYARTGVAPGEPVLLAGDGAASRLLFDVAISRGTKPLCVTDDSVWAAAVAEAGGTALASGDDLAVRATDAAGSAGLGERPWRIFDADADPASRTAALALANRASTVTLAAGAACTVDLAALVDLGATVIGVADAHPDLLTEAAALVVRGDIALADRADVVDPDDVDTLWTELGGRRRRATVIRLST